MGRLTNCKQEQLKYPLNKLKNLISKYLLLEDDALVDVVMAAVVANLLKADPLWLLIIGPPSSGKTELLRALDDLPFIQFLSTMTPQTLISGRKTKDGKSASLLFKLNGKILVLKDFTTVLSMRHEQRTEILAQLREVFDGRFSKSFGTGETIDWTGHVGFLAACTPVYDRHYGVIGSMGDRFILYRTDNENQMESGCMALNALGRESEMRQELKSSVGEFLKQFANFKFPKFNKDREMQEMIVGLASFCAFLRCPVERSYDNQCVLYEPQPEGTPRLSKQLYQLGIALSIVHGKNRMDDKIYSILSKIALDLLTVQRKTVIKFLWDSLSWEQYSQWATTSEVARGVNLPTSTAKMILEDLMILQVLRRDLKGDAENSGYCWQIAEKITDIIAFAEIFEQPEKQLGLTKEIHHRI